LLFYIKKRNGKLLKGPTCGGVQLNTTINRGTVAKSTTPHEIATIATIATTATILITIKATNCLAAVATNAQSANERLRQSFQANLARFMVIKPGTPTRTAVIILKIASRATAIVTKD